jgi:hypothetical protein
MKAPVCRSVRHWCRNDERPLPNAYLHTAVAVGVAIQITAAGLPFTSDLLGRADIPLALWIAGGRRGVAIVGRGRGRGTIRLAQQRSILRVARLDGFEIIHKRLDAVLHRGFVHVVAGAHERITPHGHVRTTMAGDAGASVDDLEH